MLLIQLMNGVMPMPPAIQICSSPPVRRCACNREGVALPAARSAEGEEDELPGHEAERVAHRVERHLDGFVGRPAHVDDAVVVERYEEAGDELTVEVGDHPYASDGVMSRPQERRV